MLCFLMDLTSPTPGINNEKSLRSLALSAYCLLAILVSNLPRGWGPGFLAVGEGGLLPTIPRSLSKRGTFKTKMADRKGIKVL